MKSISHVALRALVATATAGVSTWASGDTGDTETLVEIPPPFSTVDYERWARLVRLWLEHGAALVGMQPPRACPACGSSSGRSLFTSHDGYPFSECSDCGCWYVPRRIGPALYARFFAVCPEAHDLAEHGFAKRSSDENLAGDLDRIGAYLDLLMRYLPAGEGPRYLDIGAGTGSSLIAARDRGLVAVGVEVVAEALEIAARRGVTMLDAAAGLPSGPFGLISFWESLEHLDDPLGALRASASVLAPQGLVGVTVPNLDSPMTRIMRGDCSFVGGGSDGPGHVKVFSACGNSSDYSRGQDCRFSTLMDSTALTLSSSQLTSSDAIEVHRTSCKKAPFAASSTTSLRGIVNSLGPALALLERRTVLTKGNLIPIVTCL